ncbi:uncharacterized protein RAG0_10282 [Rhynchosporium agropyri]|uniref:Secreted protein n=1 Tax=Rhynchosporium agropyri TaxID=914238 RepID=A0A1E1KZ82_9HELO|nr:uncharacterized protein RAG0_10282 [Rhynchosporium agropyri]
MKFLPVFLGCIAVTHAASFAIVCVPQTPAKAGDAQWAAQHMKKELALNPLGWWNGKQRSCTSYNTYQQVDVFTFCRSATYGKHTARTGHGDVTCQLLANSGLDCSNDC